MIVSPKHWRSRISTVRSRFEALREIAPPRPTDAIAFAVIALTLTLMPTRGARGSCFASQKPTCAQWPCRTAYCDGDAWTCDGVKPAGTSCDDSNACTSGDHCDGAGSCVPTSSVTCPAPPVCHLSVSCSPSTGTCPTTYPNAPDGNACPAPPNATATCTAGVCGAWSCNSGYKTCGTGCIPNAQCCTNADCAIANGTLTCASGSCGAPAICGSGFKACGNACVPASQCCTSADCPAVTNGVPVCSGGACTAQCSTGYVACSSTVCAPAPPNGCCSNNDCSVSNGHATYCVNNACSITCSANSDCSLPGNIGEQTCSGGVCVDPVLCADGYRACGTNTCIAQNGCCSTGECPSGLTCSGNACSLSCPVGTQPCGTTCVATSASVCCPRDN